MLALFERIDLSLFETRLAGAPGEAGAIQIVTIVNQPVGKGASVPDVATSELPGSVDGDWSQELHRIRVEITNSPAQRVKTLAHEIAQAVLHEKYDNRPLAEQEAESTAYVVCHRPDSTEATTPSVTSQRGPVVVTKPSPGSRDRASVSRKVHPQSCGPSGPQSRRWRVSRPSLLPSETVPIRQGRAALSAGRFRKPRSVQRKTRVTVA